MPADFDVRADATGKRYLYRVQPGPVRLPLWRRTAWHVKGRLDLPAMQQAAALLVGSHDFAAFRSAQCTAATTVRTVLGVDVAQVGDVVAITVEGNAFLHNMVRIIAGTLVGVGKHRFAPDDVAQMLQSGDRVPADLRLVQVKNLQCDESAMTGESVPAEVAEGSAVYNIHRRRPEA